MMYRGTATYVSSVRASKAVYSGMDIKRILKHLGDSYHRFDKISPGDYDKSNVVVTVLPNLA